MKIDTDLLRTQYDAKTTDFQLLIETVRFILQKEIKRQKIKIHSFINRVKSFDSFLNKIRRKNISDPFREIHDLLGFRIVCLFLEDLELFKDIIAKEFDVFEEDDKIDDAELDVFGYMSLHYKAKLKFETDTQGLSTLKDNPFEIQVRTIAQDAWAAISHHLDYKRASSLSSRLRRDFHALSGLFYVADTHFSILKQEQTKFLIDETLKHSAAQLDVPPDR